MASAYNTEKEGKVIAGKGVWKHSTTQCSLPKMLFLSYLKNPTKGNHFEVTMPDKMFTQKNILCGTTTT